jgi:hypothetical protein
VGSGTFAVARSVRIFGQINKNHGGVLKKIILKNEVIPHNHFIEYLYKYSKVVKFSLD